MNRKGGLKKSRVRFTYLHGRVPDHRCRNRGRCRNLESEMQAELEFRLEGSALVGHEVTLIKQLNGNLKQRSISFDEF